MQFRKAIFIALGSLCVGLGVIGMFLPLMPTTVFLLMAAFFYSKSSDRFHNWLLTNRLFGEYISNYKAGRGIPMRQKVGSMIVLWASIVFSIWMIGASFWISLILIVIATAISVHLVLIKTYRPEEERADEPVGFDPVTDNQ